MIGDRPGEGDEEQASGVLRRAYAAPAGTAYWQGLESRIMARIAEVDLAWWNELDHWRRPMLMAAAALLVAAGIAMYHAHEANALGTYQALVAPADSADDVTPSSPREATLRSVLIARD